MVFGISGLKKISSKVILGYCLYISIETYIDKCEIYVHVLFCFFYKATTNHNNWLSTTTTEALVEPKINNKTPVTDC